jgi:hypothetical protein
MYLWHGDIQLEPSEAKYCRATSGWCLMQVDANNVAVLNPAPETLRVT